MDYRRRRKKLFTRALRMGTLTSTDAADLLGISPECASMLLMRLHRQGWLCRERYDGTYIYTPSDKLHTYYRTYPG